MNDHNTNDTLESLMQKRDNIDKQAEDINKQIKKKNHALALAKNDGSAWICRECKGFVKKSTYYSAHNPPEYEKEGLCRSCWATAKQKEREKEMILILKDSKITEATFGDLTTMMMNEIGLPINSITIEKNSKRYEIILDDNGDDDDESYMILTQLVDRK